MLATRIPDGIRPSPQNQTRAAWLTFRLYPDFAGLDPRLDGADVVVIGNGNVALDVARILAKTGEEFAGSDIAAHARDALAASQLRTITLLGRRGPHQIAMTPKELGELGHLSRAAPHVDAADFPPASDDEQLDPGQRKSVALLRGFASEPREAEQAIVFDFFAAPVAIEGGDRVERVVVKRTRVDADGRVTMTGETYAIPASLVVTCIGYRTPPIEGVPYDAAQGRFASDDGRIADGLWCVGWARRGPSGTIGTNRPDGFAVIDRIATEIGEGAGRPGAPALDALLAERGVDVVSFREWQAIEAAEVARARSDAPREKFTSVAEMMAAIARG